MNSTKTPAPAVSSASRPLLAIDRCDRCGAQAYVRFEKDDMELLFCAHHVGNHDTKLFATGFTITMDDRWKLKPGTPVA